MTELELHDVLKCLLAGWEHECVEFKSASNDCDTSEIGKYFSALGNEANLRGMSAAWLIFGVNNKTRRVSGTDYRREKERLHSLKQQIAQGTDPATSFREIHEINTPSGRVVLFEIPAAPRGIPIAWQTHYYARNGESLTGLSLAKQDEIRAQSLADDWSAVVCHGANLTDLDSEAIIKAREVFIQKYRDRIPEKTIRSWDDAAFLDRAKLTIRGGITRAAILLLGRPESAHFLSPSVAEMSWKLEGPERAYEHFHPPFFLTTSLLYQRIRNLRLTVLPAGQMIPVEISKFDQRIVLEALHNCIAHQDYARGERVLVIERPGEMVFQNAGSFFDGTPDDYLLGQRTPAKYRNRQLAEAMVHLRMIDTMGFGIREIMFLGQARRFLPLPDYDLTDPTHVILTLPGRFIDEKYSRALLANADFTLAEIVALDRVQKGFSPDETVLHSLRKRHLIEGRRPHLHISATVAAATGQKAAYIRTRRQDDAFLEKLVFDFLEQWKKATRKEIDDVLDEKLPDTYTPAQRAAKIHNLLSRLRRRGKIRNDGTRTEPSWVRVP